MDLEPGREVPQLCYDYPCELRGAINECNITVAYIASCSVLRSPSPRAVRSSSSCRSSLYTHTHTQSHTTTHLHLHAITTPHTSHHTLSQHHYPSCTITIHHAPSHHAKLSHIVTSSTITPHTITGTDHHIITICHTLIAHTSSLDTSFYLTRGHVCIICQ